MSIHFAFARKNATSPVARILARCPLADAANDNPGAATGSLEPGLPLQAALRHFARHGLGAAADARKQAEAAFFAGDRDSYRWWLGICRTLDRGVARQLVGRVGQD